MSAPRDSWLEAFMEWKAAKHHMHVELPRREMEVEQAYHAALIEAAHARGHGKVRDAEKAWKVLPEDVRESIRKVFQEPLQAEIARTHKLIDGWKQARFMRASEEWFSPPEQWAEWVLYASSPAFHSQGLGAQHYRELYAAMRAREPLSCGFETRIEKDGGCVDVLVRCGGEQDKELMGDFAFRLFSFRETLRFVLKNGGNPGVLFPGFPVHTLESKWGLTWLGNNIAGWGVQQP